MNIKEIDKRIEAWQSEGPSNRVGFAATGLTDSANVPHLSMTVRCDDLGRFAFLMLMAMICNPKLLEGGGQ